MPWPKGKSPSRAQRRKFAQALLGIKRTRSTRQRLSEAHDTGLHTAAKSMFAKMSKRVR